jgi:hypothetical protein
VLQRIIERTITPRFAAAIGALLLVPSLAGGLALDDFVHRLHARGYPFMGPARPFDMFRFMDGNPAHLAMLRERGLVPWFTPDHLRIAFFRPLSSFLHTLDYGILRLPPWAMHAESVAWYGLLCFFVGRLYARILSAPGVAGLAALFYAVDPGHGLPAGWLANRNAVLASAFAVLCLLAHDRWRRDGWRAGAIVSATSFAVALASGEMGLGALAYLAAYALTVDAGSPRTRAASLVPCGLVAVAWQVVYRAGGYGVSQSGFYCDPATAPLRFVRGFFVHSAELALGQLLVFPVEIAARATIAGGVAVAGAVALALFAWAAMPVLRRDRGVQFLALGAALALVPVAGVMPALRVLMLVGVGALGVLAALVADVAAGTERRPIARAFVRLSGGLHLVVAPILLVIYALSPVGIMRVLDRSAPGLPSVRGLKDQTVVIVRTPSSLGAAYRFGVPLDEPPTPSRALRYIAVGMGDCIVTRRDERTLDVRVPSGLLNDPLVLLYRDTPARKGERVRLSDMELEVTEEEDGTARAARVRFDEPLETPGHTWVAWDKGRFVPFAIPEIGQSVTLQN